MKICFSIDGRQICVDIPVLKPIFDPFHDPGPLREGPHPEPWITAEGIDQKTASGLQAVATMAAVTHLLPQERVPAMKEALQETAHTLVHTLHGVAIHWPWGGPGPDPATHPR